MSGHKNRTRGNGYTIAPFPRERQLVIDSSKLGKRKHNIHGLVEVDVTAVGMFGKRGGWGIPLTLYTLGITIGGIAEKPGVIDGKIEVRECLSKTLRFDHDLVDGAPAARFTNRFVELIESGVGLDT